MERVRKYRPIADRAVYEVWVSALIGNSHEYRVSVLEECEAKPAEQVDLNLARPGERRWLENYILALSKKSHIKAVFFGNGSCVGDVHYSLDRYKEIYGSWKGMDFINDLNISV